MSSQRLFLDMLARAFIAGEVSVEAITERSARLLGREWPWVRRLAKKFLKHMAGKRPRHRDVVEFFHRHGTFRRRWKKHRHEYVIAQWLMEPPSMRPVAAAANWNLPAIESIRGLADWLAISVSELGWFADLKDFESHRSPSPLSHYSYRLLTKRSGKIRLIEMPKSRLKQLQRQI